MPDNIKPTHLRIRFYIQGLGGFSGILRTRQRMKYQDGLNYLSNFNQRPRHSCVRECWIDGWELSNPPADRDPISGQIIHMHRRRMCCPATHCAKKIRDGECTDPFIIENIGKVFFAKKYEHVK